MWNLAQARGWEPGDTIALAGLAVALVSPLITLWLTGWQQRQLRKEEWNEERRRRAALVLGRTRAMLVDCDPDRLAINANGERTPALLAELRRQFESDVRPALESIAVEYPTPKERDIAAALSVALHNSITSGGWFAMRFAGESRAGHGTTGHGETGPRRRASSGR